MPQVGRRLHAGDGREPDPRVSNLLGEERADLLPEQLVDALGALAHGERLETSAGDAAARLVREALDDVALGQVVEPVEADAALEVLGHLADILRKRRRESILLVAISLPR